MEYRFWNTSGCYDAQSTRDRSPAWGLCPNRASGSKGRWEPLSTGSIATHETTGLETLWIKKQSSTNKRISATINNHWRTSG
ncbi:MAG: hypothetical protein RQ855_06960 [Desulfurococcales archaeon]|nr:hypothetical protein [Desulfurococcales archaeon]